MGNYWLDKNKVEEVDLGYKLLQFSAVAAGEVDDAAYFKKNLLTPLQLPWQVPLLADAKPMLEALKKCRPVAPKLNKFIYVVEIKGVDEAGARENLNCRITTCGKIIK